MSYEYKALDRTTGIDAGHPDDDIATAFSHGFFEGAIHYDEAIHGTADVRAHVGPRPCLYHQPDLLYLAAPHFSHMDFPREGSTSACAPGFSSPTG